MPTRKYSNDYLYSCFLILSLIIILAVFWKDEETLTALFMTNFRVDFPFDVLEIFAFVVIGVIAGLAAANFVIFHKYVSREVPKYFKTRNQRTFLYPALCSLVYATLTFPGKFLKIYRVSFASIFYNFKLHKKRNNFCSKLFFSKSKQFMRKYIPIINS